MTELAAIGRLERSRRRVQRFATPALAVEQVITIALLGLAIDRSTDQPEGLAWMFCVALLGAIALWSGTYLGVLRVRRRLGTMVLLRCQASSRNQISTLTLPLIAPGFANPPVVVDTPFEARDGSTLDAGTPADFLLKQHLAIAAADDPRTGTCLLIDLEWPVAFALGIATAHRLSETGPNDRNLATLARTVLWTRNPGSPDDIGRPEDIGRLDDLFRSYGSADTTARLPLTEDDAPIGLKVEISDRLDNLPDGIPWHPANPWPVRLALGSADIVRVADEVGASIARTAAATSGEVHLAMRTENTNAFLTGMAFRAHLTTLGVDIDDALGRLRLWRYKGKGLYRAAVLGHQGTTSSGPCPPA